MEASVSLSRILGMFFFIPFPFPNFGNGVFPFPSCSRTLGMELSVPVPELPNVIPAHPCGKPRFCKVRQAVCLLDFWKDCVDLNMKKLFWQKYQFSICFVPTSTTWLLFSSSMNNVAFVCSGINNMAFVFFFQ